MSTETSLVRETVGHLLSAVRDDELVAALDAEGWCETVGPCLAPEWIVLVEEAAAALSTAPLLDYFLVRGLGFEAGSVVYPTGRDEIGYVQGAPSRGPFLWLRGQYAGVHETVSIAPVEGLDPDLGLGAVTSVGAPASSLHVDRALDEAWVLQAAALNALSMQMLELALQHVRTREQFGRPIASFQAVKHQLADAAVALEAARAAAEFAAEDTTRAAALTARALAGRTTFDVGGTAQQMMGAMGFTWEIPLHRYVRRAHSFDLLAGPWESLAAELGVLLLAGGAAPRLGNVS